MHTDAGSIRLINIDAFLRRESMIHPGEQVDRRTKVLDSSEMTKPPNTRFYYIGGFTPRKLSTKRYSTLPGWIGKGRMKPVVAWAIKRYSIPAGRPSKTGISGCGWSLAASTSEAVQSYQRPSIRCIGGMQTPEYAMRTSMTLMVPPFPPTKTTESIPSRMDGRSGFREGGHYRR